MVACVRRQFFDSVFIDISIFLDVAAATVDIRMKKIWNENLKNPSSDDFRKLEKTIVEELQKVLPPNKEGSKPIIRVVEFK